MLKHFWFVTQISKISGALWQTYMYPPLLVISFKERFSFHFMEIYKKKKHIEYVRKVFMQIRDLKLLSNTSIFYIKFYVSNQGPLRRWGRYHMDAYPMLETLNFLLLKCKLNKKIIEVMKYLVMLLSHFQFKNPCPGEAGWNSNVDESNWCQMYHWESVALYAGWKCFQAEFYYGR